MNNNFNSWTDEELNFFTMVQMSQEDYISALQRKVASLRNKFSAVLDHCSDEEYTATGESILVSAGPVTGKQLHDLITQEIDEIDITDPYTNKITTLTADEVIAEVSSQMETLNIVSEGFNACRSQVYNDTVSFVSEFSDLITYNVPNLTASGKNLVGAMMSSIGSVSMSAVARAKSILSVIMPSSNVMVDLSSLSSNYSKYTYASPAMAWMLNVDWTNTIQAIAKVASIFGKVTAMMFQGIGTLFQGAFNKIGTWFNSTIFSGYANINKNYDILSLDRGSYQGDFYINAPLESEYKDQILHFDFGFVNLYISEFQDVYDEDDVAYGCECVINIVPKINKWLMKHYADFTTYGNSLHNFFANFSDDDWNDWYSQDLPDGFNIDASGSIDIFHKAAILSLSLFNITLMCINAGDAGAYGWMSNNFYVLTANRPLNVVNDIFRRPNGDDWTISGTRPWLYSDYINGYPDYSGAWGPHSGSEAATFYTGKILTSYSIPVVGGGAVWSNDKLHVLSDILSYLLAKDAETYRDHTFLVPYDTTANLPLGALHFYDGASLANIFEDKMRTFSKVVAISAGIIAAMVVTKKLKDKAIAASAKADLYYFSEDFDPDTQMGTYIKMVRYAGFLESLAGLAQNTTTGLAQAVGNGIASLGSAVSRGIKNIVINSGEEADPTVPEDENLLVLILKTLKTWNNLNKK